MKLLNWMLVEKFINETACLWKSGRAPPRGMNEEELLKRSAAERDRIFSCYDRGREGAEIDPWEDPGYEVYHTTDRYGFIQ